MRVTRLLAVAGIAGLMASACGSSAPAPVARAPEPEPTAGEDEPEPAPSRRGLHARIGVTCVLDPDGVPVCWGDFDGPTFDGPRRLDELGAVDAIGVGLLTGCVIREGVPACFGNYSELAMEREAMRMESHRDPQDVDAFTRRAYAVDAPLRRVVDFDLADVWGCFVTEGGALHCYVQDDAPQAAWQEMPLSGVARVAVTDEHACAALQDGRVRCWGSDASGAGLPPDGEIAPGQYTTVEGIEDAVDVVTSLGAGCALHRSGRVSCWGEQLLPFWDLLEGPDLDAWEMGELSPVYAMPDVADVRQLEAGTGHVCARTRRGTVWCWGTNEHGQLGDRTTTYRGLPVEATVFRGATEIACGDRHTCALMPDGEVRCVGDARSGLLGVPAEPTRFVRSGLRGSSMELDVGRTCVPHPDGGQLCVGSGTLNDPVAGVQPQRRMPAAGQSARTLGVHCTQQGAELRCQRGRQAHSAGEVRSHAVTSQALCAVVGTGRRALTRCWDPRDGFSLRGDVQGLRAPTEVVLTGTRGCAIHDGGQVACFSVDEDPIDATAIDGIEDAVELGMGYAGWCARRRGGQVACWGPRMSRAVGSDELTGIAQLAIRGGEACFRHEDGGVTCRTSSGLQRAALSDVIDLAAGPAHVCARTRDNDVWCRGAGASGELGVVPEWLHLEPVTVLPAP